jgi:hypothetical protein
VASERAAEGGGVPRIRRLSTRPPEAAVGGTEWVWACWPIVRQAPSSGGGIPGGEVAGIRAHVLLCLLRAEAVAGAGVGWRDGLVAEVPVSADTGDP